MKNLKKILDNFFIKKSKCYGDYNVQFEKLSIIFNNLTGKKLNKDDCILILIILKILRHQEKYKKDNIIDAIGYLRMLIKNDKKKKKKK